VKKGPWPAELPAGGGPAGVVDALLKRELPDEAGVAVLVAKILLDESPEIPVAVV
jgi:hypothetical protein